MVNLLELENKLKPFGIKITGDTTLVINKLSSIWEFITDEYKKEILSYMGLHKSIEDKRYMTFDEARRTAKKIRYAGNTSDLNRDIKVFNKFDYPQFYISSIIGCMNTNQLNRIFDDEKWEVEM